MGAPSQWNKVSTRNKRLQKIKRNALFVDYCQYRKCNKINEKLIGANKRGPKDDQM